MNQFAFSKRRAALLGSSIGIVCFLLVWHQNTQCDARQLDFAAYDEFDIIQRYMGQVHLCASDWGFPLMMANTLAVPDGTITVFTDSYPLVMIFVKLLSPFLPVVFQIEDWCVLVHFALQGAAVALLARRVCTDWLFCSFATIPFTLSPILLERAFRHTMLSAHFIILFSIYAYLEYRDALARGECPRLPWTFWLMGVLSVGTSPYFLPMCMIFALAAVVEDVRYRRRVLHPVLRFAGCCVVSMFFVYLLGSVAHNVSASRGALILAAIAFVQIVDISSAFFQKRAWNTGLIDEVEKLGSGSVHGTVISELIESAAVDVLDDCRFLRITSSNGDRQQLILLRYLAMFAGRVGVPTNFWDANSGTYPPCRCHACRIRCTAGTGKGRIRLCLCCNRSGAV